MLADSTRRSRIRTVYGIDFPDDFFHFEEFLGTLEAGILEDAVGMHLESPFRVSRGQSPSDINPLWESRYYNDPPEFVTVLRGEGDGLHWGYYFDDPSSGQAVVCHFYSNDAFQLAIDGDNLFQTLYRWIEAQVEDIELDRSYGLNDLEEYRASKDRLIALRQRLEEYLGNSLPTFPVGDLDGAGSAWRRPTAPTRCDMGIVIPPRQYRPREGTDLHTDTARAWNYIPTLEDVHRQVKDAMGLLQKGYPGAALKLGKDLWIYHDHHMASYALLDAAYAALGRNWLQQALTVAREYRDDCERRRSG